MPAEIVKTAYNGLVQVEAVFLTAPERKVTEMKVVNMRTDNKSVRVRIELTDGSKRGIEVAPQQTGAMVANFYVALKQDPDLTWKVDNPITFSLV